MTRTTISRPRMAAIYAAGTVRARRWNGDGDVRGYRPPSGWTACADLTDIHPITGRACRVPCGGSSRRRNNRSAPRPGRSVLGAVDKIRARQWPRPVFKATSRIGTPPPSRQLRRRR